VPKMTAVLEPARRLAPPGGKSFKRKRSIGLVTGCCALTLARLNKLQLLALLVNNVALAAGKVNCGK